MGKFNRNHILNMSRIKFSHATQTLGEKTIFQSGLSSAHCRLPGPDRCGVGQGGVICMTDHLGKNTKAGQGFLTGLVVG